MLAGAQRNLETRKNVDPVLDTSFIPERTDVGRRAKESGITTNDTTLWRQNGSCRSLFRNKTKDGNSERNASGDEEMQWCETRWSEEAEAFRLKRSLGVRGTGRRHDQLPYLGLSLNELLLLDHAGAAGRKEGGSQRNERSTKRRDE
jgi:hypothetical protein